MRYLIILLYLSVNVPILLGQNLVKNPSFEEYWFFPKSLTKSDTSFCKYWYSIYECTPDYYHENNSCGFKSANNLFGLCNGYDGKAYVGLCFLSWDGMTEHITGTLNEPLKKGELYKIKIKTKFSGEHCKFFLNRLCVRFTKAKQWIYKDAWVSYDYLVANKFTPNVFWTLDLNSSKWVTLESEYVAQGGENYISIGMFPIDKFSNELDVLKYLSLKRDGKKKKLNKFFKDNQLLLKLNESFTTASLIDVKDGAYYFIDKVSITPVCSDK